MKKAFCILASLVMTLSAADTLTAPKVMVGAGPKIGSDGYGISVRMWINNRFGLSINGGSTSAGDQEGGEGQLHYKFLRAKKISPYVLLGGGVQRIDIEETTPVQENVALGTITAGAGAEALLGKNRNHGLSVEAAYRSGAVEYRARSSTIIGQDDVASSIQTKELDHFSVKALYHFYFVPWHKIDRDADDDGILDKIDACPTQAEDLDGFKDSDGCPELDNDGDGIADLQDRAPLESEDKDGFEDSDGVPDPDNDGDGIADGQDRCPNAAETVNGFEDSDGCDDVVPVVEKVIEVVPVKTEVKAVAAIHSQMITFQAEKSTLANSGIPTLNQLIDTLKTYPNVRVEIAGHTDNSGDAQKNRKLSKDRADQVKLFLTNSGISKERITTKGYGPDRPIVSNDTAKNRKKNRRVEIVPIQ